MTFIFRLLGYINDETSIASANISSNQARNCAGKAPSSEICALPLATLKSEPTAFLAPPSENLLELAWDVLSKDSSWKSVEAKHEWHHRLGAHDVSALEFLMDEEIDDLEQWLTTIPFRRFKKFMGK